MKHFIKYILLIFFAAIITSCTTVKENEKKITSGDKQDEQVKTPETQEKNEKKLELKNLSDEANIKMQAKIKIQFPDMNNSATATIEMAKKDSILINLYGPFGISVGKLYANPNEIIMNNSLQSITFTGVPDEKTIMKIVNIPLSFNDLITILRTSTPQEINNYNYSSTTNEYSFETENYTEKIIIDENNDILSLKRINDENEEIITAEFSQFGTIGNYRFAKNVTVNFPFNNGKISINFSEIEILNKPTTPMRFEKPKSYRELKY